jgi:phenylalanyl-tRNA synthetase beta chain
MLVSLRWLRDYVDIDSSPQELAERLTMAGLEVDSIKEYRPDFTDVVTAKILGIKPHPDADKLSLCEVTTGESTFPVVCGAKNMRAGDMVALAKVGAHLPGGYTIKSSKIRGELSEGMLCSEEELGIGPDATGIMILPKELRPGQDLVAALDLTDLVFDIGVTPNRSDCLCIIGISREAAAVTGQRLRYPKIEIDEAGENIRKVTAVDILDSRLCPRYAARVVKGVRIGPSPRWMRQRLEAVGLRPISNVVDVTNFVMMEFGQPLHAFDFRYLEEGRIIVRGAGEGEEFVSLDGKVRTLNADTLMICDGVKPVAIAGIMGGLNSEIMDDTETVLLESAYFNPASIRRSARVLGMSTDAAFRFERGIDPEGVIRALDRAAQLIVTTAGGQICQGAIDNYPNKIPPVKDIPLRAARVKEILGKAVPGKEIRKVLDSLEMKVSGRGKDFLVTPPTFRVDISREIDLIEEVARLRGYDSIPESIPPANAREDIKDKKGVLDEKVKVFLNGCGCSEVINYSFTTPASADTLGLKTKDIRRSYVKIMNPLTEDQSVMRTTLVYGLLETMKKNVNNGSFDLKFFERGKVFISESAGGELPRESEKLGALIAGARYDSLWHTKGLQADFYDLKGCLENLLALLRIDVRFEPASDIEYLHPGRSCRVLADGKEMGVIGEVHPDVIEKMDLKRRAMIFEVDFDFLVDHFSDRIRFREVRKYPVVTRDMAFVVSKDLEAEKLVNLARAGMEELLEKIEIFDVYIGKNIPEGMKSLALRFTYRSEERTLTDEEVARIHGGIVKRIISVTGARVRGE